MYNFYKRIFISIAVLTIGLPFITSAQRKPGNEWINYSQTYYKIKVVQNGIYRISYTDLQSAGMNAGSVNPTHLQLFFRGAEVPLFLSSGTAGTWGSSDYLEFYGQGNDGALDSVLYLKPSDFINRSYSMYSDTAVYFLTEGAAASTARYKISAKNYSGVPINSYIAEGAVYLHDTFTYGTPIYPDLNFNGSDYNAGIGYTGKFISTVTYNSFSKKNYRILTPDPSLDTVNNPKPQLEILIYGKSDVSGQILDHHLVIYQQPSGKAVFDTTFAGYATIHKTLTRYWSDILNDDSVTYTVAAGGVKPPSGTFTSDAISVSFLKFRYAAQYKVNPADIALSFSYLNKSANAQNDFSFRNNAPLAGTKSVVLYDLTHAMKTPAYSMTGTAANFAIDNFKENTSYYVTDAALYKKALSISKLNFVKPDPGQNYNYVIVTSKAFAAGAQAFADYKKTQTIDTTTSNFNPVIAYTDDLYDQFFYGIHHPAAVQNYMAYMYNNAAQKPQYLLLLGKGINPAEVRRYLKYDYVPAVGYPCSDVMFTAGIDIGFQGRDKLIDPKMGIGRLQVLSNQDVYSYLDKLKDYDASLKQPKAYLKNAINVDGGDNNEITLIQGFMDGQAKVLSQPLSGLNVTSYYSFSSSYVNKDLTKSIQNNLERGVCLLNYLAHGAAEELQVEFTDTTTLANTGKYPIMYLNGCNLGDAFTNPKSSSYGRFFTLAPKKGSMIWLSHSNQALDNVLFAQMPAFFNNIAKDNYGKSVGSSWRKTIVDLKKLHSADDFRALCYEWELQGDPSIMFPSFQTDYAVADSSLFIYPKNTVASSPSFKVGIPVSNFGKAVTSKMKVHVKITFPDHSVQIYDSLLPSARYYDTLYFTVNRGSNSIQGVNKIDVTVNADSAISELSYANNHASITHFFEGNSARAVFPEDFGIQNTDTPLLVSQSRSALAINTGIYFEIDTTARFNSPLLQRSPVLKGSSLEQWQPKLNYRDKNGDVVDTVVYYWRTRMNLGIDSGGQWDTHSFVYMKNSKGPGWSQSHWQQYGNVSVNQMLIDTAARNFSYLPQFGNFTVEANAYKFANMSIKQDIGFWEVFGTDIGNCGVAMIEYDKNTLQPYVYNRITGKRLHGRYLTNGLNVNYLAYDMTQKAYRDSFAKEISLVPEGNLILLCSRGIVASQGYTSWEEPVFKAFEQFGDTMMRHLKPQHEAFVIAGFKGTPKGKLIKEASNYDTIPDANNGDTAIIKVSVQGIANDSGIISSAVFGPATKWHAVRQKFNAQESTAGDKSYLTVTGIDAKGTGTVLYSRMTAPELDISSVDASKYPYLKFSAMVKDTISWTPPQLRLWQAEFDHAPDGSLIGDNETIYPQGRYNQGDVVHARIKFQNISAYPMTRVQVAINIFDKKNKTFFADTSFHKPLQPGEYFWIDTTYSTKNMSGEMSFNIMVNPNYQQPEFTLDNNFVQFTFDVSSDNINPVMDVTFDGTHIADNQIVSATPEIKVRVSDENKQLVLNDTADYTLTLWKPNASKPEQVHFSGSDVQFVPGDSISNTSLIIYKPAKLNEGTYRLNVQATDRSGNAAGPAPYDIHFRVVADEAMSNVYFYPNPLTDVSRFVFTITGSHIPELLSIKIYDLAGKEVKTIDLHQDNTLRAGVNEYYWDGTDDGGARLRPGIYMYKVIVQNGGSTPKKYSLPEDQQLEQGYGKIMIIGN